MTGKQYCAQLKPGAALAGVQTGGPDEKSGHMLAGRSDGGSRKVII